jgi:hypothetical protein
MLVYGKADTGKTQFGSTWPKPILYLGFNEKGTATIKTEKDVDILELQNWDDFEEAYWYLKEGTRYNTIVFDQITSLQGFCIEHVRKKAKKKPDELFNQKNWGQVSGNLKTWIGDYRDLSDQYNLLFLAHERTFNSNDEEEDGVIDPFIGAAVMPSLNTFVTGAVTAIGNTFIKERWEGKGNDRDRHVEFCMRTGPSAYYFTKIRRPVTAGPVDEYVVNPTYSKIKALIDGESTEKPRRKKPVRRKSNA